MESNNEKIVSKDFLSKINVLPSNRFIDDLAVDGTDQSNSDDHIGEEDFTNIIGQYLQDNFTEGKIIEGTVIGLDKDNAIIDAGLKSEGRVPLKEFELGEGSDESIKIGQKIKFFLEKVEGRNGNIVLSREKAIRDELWGKLEEATKNKTEVEGVIFGSIKCGHTVDIGGVVAFLPASHVDLRQVKDITPLLGTKQKFLILKMDKKQGNIVVSRKAILEASHVDARNLFLKQLNEGDVIEGKIKSVTSYGAFVGIHESNEVGVIDGLLHITDISWSRVSHPSEVFSPGDVIKVKIIKIDRDTRRISLGVKQLEESPWHNIEKRYPISSVHQGTVTSIENYGVFVELEVGLEGLVHISEISWTKNNLPVNQSFTIGQKTEVKILNIEPGKNRISLSIRKCKANPSQDFSYKYPLGSVVPLTIKNILDFGIFVKFNDDTLDPDIDGLIYHTDLSWSNKPEEEIEKYTVGQQIMAKVLMININKCRINLGIKHLERDPFEDFLRKTSLGEKIPVIVSKIEDGGILVDVNDGSTVFIENEHLPDHKKFSPGDKLEAEVLSIEAYNLILSLK